MTGVYPISPEEGRGEFLVYCADVNECEGRIKIQREQDRR